MKSVYLLGHCNRCKAPHRKKLNTIIDNNDLKASPCQKKNCDGLIVWEQMKVQKKRTWIWVAGILAILLLSAAALYERYKGWYSSDEITEAIRKTDKKTVAEIIRDLPGTTQTKAIKFGISPAIVRQLENEEVRPSPILESVLRGAAVQCSLDGALLFLFKRYYFFSPYAIQTYSNVTIVNNNAAKGI